MINDFNYETFIFLSDKKFVISVIQSNDARIIYEEKKLIDNDLSSLEIEKLNKFLEDNVFKIEKEIKDFIKEIYIILDTKKFLPIQVSIKNENDGNILTTSSISYSLNEAKEQCFKMLNQEKIIHMIIDNYCIDNKNFSYLPNDIICKSFSLDLTFICLSNIFVKDLENIMKKYQISINQILSYDYIIKAFNGDDRNLFKKAKDIVEGFNENEVLIRKKIPKNIGFFEKFFNFFS